MRWFGNFELGKLLHRTGLVRPSSATSGDHDRDPMAAVVEPPAAPSREELVALVRSFPFWYQRIYLGHGVYSMETGGYPAYHERVWERLKPSFPDDFRGASVLDVGCNAGYFALQIKMRGAGRVLGIELWEDFLKQATLCRQIWNLDIDYRMMDAHQLTDTQEQFDIVVFAGILYHLKNPLQILEDVGKICRDAILVESEVITDDPRNCVYLRQGSPGNVAVRPCRKGMMKFIEADELNGDGSNWWVPDTECVVGMLRTAGFKYFSTPIYLAESRLLLVASKREDSLLDLLALK
jgi:tRNA (mo5U34)-methyltransferase